MKLTRVEAQFRHFFIEPSRYVINDGNSFTKQNFHRCSSIMRNVDAMYNELNHGGTLNSSNVFIRSTKNLFVSKMSQKSFRLKKSQKIFFNNEKNFFQKNVFMSTKYLRKKRFHVDRISEMSLAHTPRQRFVWKFPQSSAWHPTAFSAKSSPNSAIILLTR